MTNGFFEAGIQFQLQYSRHLVDLRTHCGPRLALASWIEGPPRNALLLSLCLQSWICMWRWKEGEDPSWYTIIVRVRPHQYLFIGYLANSKATLLLNSPMMETVSSETHYQ